jgi:hypothetical protein
MKRHFVVTLDLPDESPLCDKELADMIARAASAEWVLKDCRVSADPVRAVDVIGSRSRIFVLAR